MGRAGRVVQVAAPVLACVAILAVSLPASAAPGFYRRAPMPFPVAWTATHPTLSYADISCPAVTQCTTIGAYLNTEGAFVPSTDTEVDGSWLAPTSIALPSGATPYLDGLRSISCPAVGDCVAVGTAQSPNPLLEPIVAVETDGVWSGATAKVPLPKGTVLGYLWSVWCSSMASCVAAGSYSTSIQGTQHAFIDSETNGTWALTTTLADPQSTSVTADLKVFPQGISCEDQSDCVVVGYFNGSPATTTQLAFGVVERHGTWGAPRVFDPDHSEEAFLSSVACSAIGCVAAGTSFPPGSLGTLPYAVTYRDGSWRNPAYLYHHNSYHKTVAGALTSVSCPTESLCVAVGSLTGVVGNQHGHPSADDDNLLPVAYTWYDGTWSTVSVLPAKTIGQAEAAGATFNAISCATVNRCLATGTTVPAYTAANEEYPFSVQVAPVAPNLAPSAPTSVRVRARHDRFDVTWHAPSSTGGSRIVSYEATAISTTAPTQTCSTRTTSCPIGGIRAGARYVLEVVAKNATGRIGQRSRTRVTGR